MWLRLSDSSGDGVRLTRSVSSVGVLSGFTRNLPSGSLQSRTKFLVSCCISPNETPIQVRLDTSNVRVRGAIHWKTRCYKGIYL